MKTIKTLKLLILTGILALSFLTCDVSLGSRLDLDGPAVSFTSPAHRKSVGGGFVIEGEVSDFKGISEFLLTATVDGDPFEKQWRYKGSKWEISEDFGGTWNDFLGETFDGDFIEPQWNGDNKKATFSIPISVEIGSPPAAKNGEFMFFMQAWDINGVTDENSFRTRVFIVDPNAPKIEISNPYLYGRDQVTGTTVNTGSELAKIHDKIGTIGIADDDVGIND